MAKFVKLHSTKEEEILLNIESIAYIRNIDNKASINVRNDDENGKNKLLHFSDSYDDVKEQIKDLIINS
ncbi:MAG: hypothetical protein J6P64_00990 [Bacteroidales bacterium]|nr:hypothetical protein [Bacteroidales bacterium]